MNESFDIVAIGSGPAGEKGAAQAAYYNKTVALERLMTRKSEVVTVMIRAVERNLTRHGVELIQGRARLGPGRAVRVSPPDREEHTLKGKVILLATGSHPVLPTGAPFDDPDVYDPVNILQLDRLPGGLLVVGGRWQSSGGVSVRVKFAKITAIRIDGSFSNVPDK
jgi:NAD(P) transhydrogenase